MSMPTAGPGAAVRAFLRGAAGVATNSSSAGAFGRFRARSWDVVIENAAELRQPRLSAVGCPRPVCSAGKGSCARSPEGRLYRDEAVRR